MYYARVKNTSLEIGQTIRLPKHRIPTKPKTKTFTCHKARVREKRIEIDSELKTASQRRKSEVSSANIILDTTFIVSPDIGSRRIKTISHHAKSKKVESTCPCIAAGSSRTSWSNHRRRFAERKQVRAEH